MDCERINLEQPRWNQNTFYGRLKYFSSITDPRLSLVPTNTLLQAKELLEKYKKNEEPAGTTREQVYYAQRLVQSAFHPDTGDLQNLVGRMSFQTPGGMILIGAMVSFYRSNVAVVFWQWMNQSFNSLVNYTNRNAASDITPKKIATAYVMATSSALVTALSLKSLLAKRASPLMQRFVPFAAVAAANMVNVPLMRQSELVDGVTVYDENNNQLTESRYAAIKGISQVVFSRIIMCTPGMTLLPVLMEQLEKLAWVQRYHKFLNAPLQIALSGVTLIFMVPLGCALFNQRCSISVDHLKYLDADKLEDLKHKHGEHMPKILYFNKGL